MTGTLHVSRSRGAFSGVLLILLGLWGGLVPLVGPYLHYAYTPDKPWTITSGRIWLEFLPAAAAIVGGAMVVASKLRPSAMLGASLAVASGAWFAFGTAITNLLMKNSPVPGTAVGGSVARALEHFGFFTGLGAVLIFVGTIALGRLSIISARDTRTAERAARAEREAARAGADTGDVTSLPADTDTETVPTPAAGGPRRTPVATMIRRASRDKSDSRDGDSGSASASRDQVTSGSTRS